MTSKTTKKKEALEGITSFKSEIQLSATINIPGDDSDSGIWKVSSDGEEITVEMPSDCYFSLSPGSLKILMESILEIISKSNELSEKIKD